MTSDRVFLRYFVLAFLWPKEGRVEWHLMTVGEVDASVQRTSCATMEINPAHFGEAASPFERAISVGWLQSHLAGLARRELGATSLQSCSVAVIDMEHTAYDGWQGVPHA